MKNFLNFKLIISLALLMVFIGMFIPLDVFAFDDQYITQEQFDGYENLSKTKIGGRKIGGIIRRALGIILTMVRTITLGWAIIMAIAIAMKYMTGSAEIKSQLKTDMPTYVIGAILLFGASGIITLLQFFVDKVSSTK